MENNELKDIIESKAKDYFNNEGDKLLEWRNKRMITKYEYQDLIFTLQKDQKMFYSLLNEILK